MMIGGFDMQKRHHISGVFTLLAAIVLIAGCASTDKYGVPLAPTAPGFGETVGDVSCDSGGHDAAFHLHTQLAVYLPDGTSADVPPDIGVGTGCMYWLHTHAETGELHVEAPAATAATLADFLEIWRRSTNPTIPDAVNAGLAEVKVLGEVVSDPASIELTDGLGIVITLTSFPQP
jgi:hypothetical protein